MRSAGRVLLLLFAAVLCLAPAAAAAPDAMLLFLVGRELPGADLFAQPEAYLYLALYNLVYVVPLAAIVLLFAVTLGARKLSEFQGRVLKLLSGTMMLGLGFALLLRPEALGSVAAGAWLLGGSIAVTALVVASTRRMGGAA